MQGSLSWEISVSGSQLTLCAGVRYLGTIRMGGCNLEDRGGKLLRERDTKSDLHVCHVTEIARVHHLQPVQCRRDEENER